MQGADHGHVAVLLLGVGDVVGPLGPEGGAAEVVQVVLRDRVAQPAHPFRAVGGVLRVALHAAGEGPPAHRVDAVEQLVRAGEAAGGGRGGAHHAPVDGVAARGAGVAGDLHETRSVQGEARLPLLAGRIAAQDVAIGLPGTVHARRVVQVAARVQAAVPVHARRVRQGDLGCRAARGRGAGSIRSSSAPGRRRTRRAGAAGCAAAHGSPPRGSAAGVARPAVRRDPRPRRRQPRRGRRRGCRPSRAARGGRRRSRRGCSRCRRWDRSRSATACRLPPTRGGRRPARRRAAAAGRGGRRTVRGDRGTAARPLRPSTSRGRASRPARWRRDATGRSGRGSRTGRGSRAGTADRCGSSWWPGPERGRRPSRRCRRARGSPGRRGSSGRGAPAREG